MLATMWISPLAMAASLLVSNVLSQIINSWPNKKLLNYSYLEQIKDMVPNIALSIIMGVIVYCVNFLHFGNITTLAIQVLLGAVIYILGSKIFRLDSFEYILGVICSLTTKKHK